MTYIYGLVKISRFKSKSDSWDARLNYITRNHMVIKMTEHAILVLFIYNNVTVLCPLTVQTRGGGGGFGVCGGIACVISHVRDRREKM